MGVEIERKFLVKDGSWQPAMRSVRLRQAYISTGPPASVRVRIAGDVAILNIKRQTGSITRDEFEYSIPVADAEAIMQGLCVGRPVEKTRHYVVFEGLTWEIDVFEGANAGLVVAEVELEREDQDCPLPPWVGEEVSTDPRYLNANLALDPYTEW